MPRLPEEGKRDNEERVERGHGRQLRGDAGGSSRASSRYDPNLTPHIQALPRHVSTQRADFLPGIPSLDQQSPMVQSPAWDTP